MSKPSRIQLVSVTEVAAQLDCSRGHVYNLAAAGHFQIVDLRASGTRPKTRLYQDEVDAYIRRQTRAAAAKAS